MVGLVMSILCRLGIHKWYTVGKPIYTGRTHSCLESILFALFGDNNPYYNNVCIRCGKCDNSLTKKIYKRMIQYRKILKEERRNRILANKIYNSGCRK